MTLEDEDVDNPVVIDKPKPDFAELAAVALNNTGINANERIQAAQRQPATPETGPVEGQPAATGPALVENAQNKIVYEIVFNLPDDGLVADTVIPPENTDTATQTTGATPRQYPTRLRRSVDRYTPTFLQLGEVQAHRSVVDVMKPPVATKEERMHATTWTDTTMTQNDTNHLIDKEMVTQSEDKLKVWAYVMTQYNLKPGLRKFGARGATAAIDELTQLHIMDTWTAMAPSKISREERIKALSSLLFLKEKRTGKIKR